jgi:hypothetical protein
MRKTIFGLVLMLATGCFADGVVGSGSVVGTYTLRTVNGAPPPVAITTGGTTVEILEDTLRLFQGLTWASNGRTKTTVAGQATVATVAETGYYGPSGTSISFTSSDGRKTRLSILYGNTLTFVENGVTSVYSK